MTLELPEPDHDGAALLLTLGPAHLSKAMGPSDTLEIEHESDEPTELEVMIYDRPLDTLGYREGQDLGAKAGEQPRPLPRPDRTYSARIDEEGPSGWTFALEPSGRAKEYAWAPQDSSFLCTCFGRRATNVALIRSASDARYAIPLDEGSVLLGTADEGFVFGPSDEPERVATSTAIEITAGFRTSDGQLWFASEEGELFSGTLGERALSLERVAVAPVADGIGWISGRGARDDFEIYALSTSGRLWKFGPRRTEELEVDGEGLFPPMEPMNRRAGVAYLGPGLVVAVAFSSPEVGVYRDGRLERSSVESAGLSVGLTAVARTEHLGTVIGTATGNLLSDVGGEGFKLLAKGASAGPHVRAIYEAGPGHVMFAGSHGYFSEYRQDLDALCSARALSGSTVTLIAPQGSDLLLVGGGSGATDGSLVVVRLSPVACEL